MKVLILGATGKVGRLITQQALEQGHEVTALVRSPAKLPSKHVHLTPFVGDALDAGQIKAAMVGQHAIISALGHNASNKSSKVLTIATRAVLANLTSDQRYISLTGDGVGDPKDPPVTFAGKFLNGAIKRLLGDAFTDGRTHADLLRASSSNWILVRSPRMDGGPATHPYKVGYLSVGFATHASRADVADFMLACLRENTWLRQAPIIASA